MKLIVSLGNPGTQYAQTRHNMGFIILDYIAEKNNLNFKAGKGEWYEAHFMHNGRSVYLMKPTTFMNNSGLAISDFIDRNNIEMKDILTVFDDFQIPLGTIRIRETGSDGGHNGISSIIYHLNTLDFPRMRVGIGTEKEIKKDDYTDFVLSNFTEDELVKVKQMLPLYKEAIFCFIDEGIKNAMNMYNKNYFKTEE
jgi:PTH1 family peptidyl-tRNA hydrolase